MIIQIYEITNVNEALRVAGLGSDHIGVVVGDGNYVNEIRPFKAREIFLSLPKDKKGVALTLSNNIEDIKKIITDSQPDIIHIASGMEEIMPQDLEEIKKEFPQIEIMRTIPVIGEESVAVSLMYDGVADYLLLDTKDSKSGKVGVTGKTHNWGVSAKIVESVAAHVILAGGLGPENVAEAIKTVNPHGVDSKTKTDKTGGGEKDLIKVKLFIEKAKSVQI